MFLQKYFAFFFLFQKQRNKSNLKQNAGQRINSLLFLCLLRLFQMWEQSWKRAGDGKGKVRMFVFKLVHAPKGLSHVTIAKPIFIKCKSISAVSDLGRAIRKYCNLVFHLCWLADISVSVWHAIIIKRAWHFTKFGKQMRALGIFSPFKFFSGYINLLSNVTEKLHLHAHTYTRFF